MTTSLIVWAALSATADLTEVHDNTPTFVDPTQVNLQQHTVALFTHCSSYFDPLRMTQDGVQKVASVMKRRGFPTVYFHDRYNQNNPWHGYLYSDWKPTAFVESEIGFYDFDLSKVRHVVCVGGFFWRCEKNTVATSIRLWRRDAPKQNFRITQVVDGIFDVAEAVVPPYYDRVRQFQREVIWAEHDGASLTLEQILHLIGDDELAVEFLERQLPELPENVNVVIDIFGRKFPIQSHKANEDDGDDGDAPTLTLCYRTSESFLGNNSSESQLRFSTVVGEFVRWPRTIQSWLKSRNPRKQTAGRSVSLPETASSGFHRKVDG